MVTSITTDGVVVAAGSVWESRMKVDQVKGGIKVFNGDDDNNPLEIVEQNTSTTSTSTNTEIQVYKRMPPKQGLVGKRKTWKTENSENGIDQKTQIQIARKRSELAKNLDGKELSVSVKKSSPIKVADGVKKTPRKSRSGGVNGEFSSSTNMIDRNARRELMDESSDDIAKVVLDSRGIKKSPSNGVAKIRSCGDDNCEDKVITSDLGSGSQVKSSPTKLLLTYAKSEDDFVEESVDDVLEEIEKTSFDVKEVSSVTEHKAKKVVIEVNEIQQGNVKSAPISSVVKKQLPPVVKNPRIVSNYTKSKPVPFADEFHRAPKEHCTLQSFVDLVMWRDASRSAFIFGLGTFIIISSSYTTDINISLITVLSYLGLVYLAAIFLFRSIICRGAIKEDDDTSQEHVVREEEAIWLLKLALPYLNEFLLNLRALFSGDPATTMKLAVLLFVLARCGSSITIWKMAKLGYFGVFTVPKICSSYSFQLTAFGTFWIQRFKDACESCSYKKGVGFFIFTVMWNLSSIIARIWAVFMLFVAFKYYQQQYLLMNKDDYVGEEEATGESVDVKMGLHT